MKKALILDRDGVVNREQHYVCKIEDFEFVDGIFDVSRFFAERGFLIFIVTNQAGIGRGYYTESDFAHLTKWMEEEFRRNGVRISRTFFCPFHPTEGVGQYRKDSFDRKPNPGMILAARDEFDLNLSASILVGDKESDIEAGRSASVGTTVLLRGSQSPDETVADYEIASLSELKNIIPE